MKDDVKNLAFNIAKLETVAGQKVRSMPHARQLLARHGHKLHVLQMEQLQGWCRERRLPGHRPRSNINWK